MAHLRLLFQKPGQFWEKVQKRYRKLASELFIDKPTSRFIEHNLNVFKGWVNFNSTKEILIDWQYGLPVWYVPGLFFANVLARKKGARLCSFAREQWPWARSTHEIYRSFNVTEHIVMSKLSEDQRNRQERIYDEVISRLKTKEDVFNLKVNGIHIGLDIYESYLREFNKPTVYLDEPLLSIVHLSIGYLIFWEDYFNDA